ncbi:MAG: ABC transporter substrate-binding protein [Rhizobiaceae bacterium]
MSQSSRVKTGKVADAAQAERISAERPKGGKLIGTRRQFLAGAAAAGAVGVLGFPAIKAKAAETGPVKFGLLEDQSGNFALFGLPKLHATQLAIKEINDGFTLMSGPTGPGGTGKDGAFTEQVDVLVPSNDKGINGREVTLISPDPQSEPRMYQQLTKRLGLQDEADVIMGAFASANREAMRPVIDQMKKMYWYNNQYEGGVADKYTFCTGAVAEQQIIPAMQYCISKFGKRIYIPAADYNFGQLSAMWTRAMAPLLGGEVVGQEFIPLSVTDFTSTIARIEQAKPDWLMMYITGQNHANFYPQANAAGLKRPMGSSINLAQGYEHKRFAPPALAGMNVAVSYMEEIPTPRNQAFVKRFRKMFPDEPYIQQEAHSAYVATHLYAVACRLAKTAEQGAVMEVLESGIGIEAPAGWMFMDPATHHMSQHIRMASCDEKHNITFVQEWPSIEPWWTRRLGVNLVKTPEFKQYTPADDPAFKKFL